MKKSFSDVFANTIDSFSREMHDFPWENRQAYVGWLTQTYFFVRHSTRLLSLTAAKFDLEQEPSHQRYLTHISEEKSHEKLAIHDLKELGFDLKEGKELPSTSALYQTQYYWIERFGPNSFLGYIFALEGIADHQGAKVCERVIGAHGAKAARFVKVHANEDEEHLKKAFSLLDGLDEKSLDSIIANFEQSCFYYVEMLNSVKKTVLEKEHNSAA